MKQVFIDRFDGGMQKKRSGNAYFSFVKGDISREKNTIYPYNTLEEKNGDAHLGISTIGVTQDFGIVGVGKGMTTWLTKSALSRYEIKLGEDNENYFYASNDATKWTAGAGCSVSNATQESIQGVTISIVSSGRAFFRARNVVNSGEYIILYYNVSGLSSLPTGYKGFNIYDETGLVARFDTTTSTWGSVSRMSLVSDTVYAGDVRKVVFQATSNIVLASVDTDSVVHSAVNFFCAFQVSNSATELYIPTIGDAVKVKKQNDSIVDVGFIPIDTMPQSFWDDVTSNYSNVVLANSQNEKIENWKMLYFDKALKKGVILCKDQLKYVYILDSQNDGNSTGAQSIQATSLFLFDNNTTDTAGNAVLESGTPAYVSTKYGNGMSAHIEFQVNWQRVPLTATFSVKKPTVGVAERSVLSNSSDSNFRVTLTYAENTNTFTFKIGGFVSVGSMGGAGGSYNTPATIAQVTAEAENTFSFVLASGDTRLYHNGRLVSRNTASFGSFSGSNAFIWTDSTGYGIDNLILQRTANFNEAQFLSVSQNSHVSFGAKEAYTDAGHTYAGVQLYRYDTTTNEWKDIFNTHFVKTFSIASSDEPSPAINGAVFQTGSVVYFPVVITGVIKSMSAFDYSTGITDWTASGLESGSDTSQFKCKAMSLPYTSNSVTVATASTLTQIDKFASNVVTEADFGSGYRINGMTISNRYVVIGGTLRGDAYGNATTDALTTSFQEYDFGVGDLRVLKDLRGSVVAVVDGVTSNNIADKFVDIRTGEGETIVSISAIEGDLIKTISFNNAISPCEARTKNGVVFWGDIVVDGVQARGIFHVSKNVETGTISLSFLTSFLQEPRDIVAIGDSIYILGLDKKLYGKSTSYDTVEIHTTLIGDDRTRFKEPSVVQVSTTENSTVTVSTKTIHENTFTEQFTASGDVVAEGVISTHAHREAVYKVTSTKPVTTIKINYNEQY